MRRLSAVLLVILCATSCTVTVKDVNKWEKNKDIEPLIALLMDENSGLCAQAGYALANIGQPAVPPLITALRHKNSCVRGIAAEALGRIGDTRAIKPLIAALREKNPCIRGATANALVNIGTPAIEPLVRELQDKNAAIRLAAAEALDRIGWQPKTSEEKLWFFMSMQQWHKITKLGADAVSVLMQILADETWDYRWEAAEVLAKIGKPAVKSLIHALQDGKTRGAAGWVLGRIGAEAVEPLMESLQDGRVRGAALKALGQIGKPAVLPLIKSLKDYDAWVRSNVAKTLGDIGDKRAVDPLTAAFKDPNWRVRKSIAKALEKLLVSKR